MHPPYGDVLPTLLVVLVGSLILAASIYGWVLERRRSAALQQLAGRLNLRFLRRDNSLPARYAFLDDLDKGEDRYAYNVLEGVFEDQTVLVFDYHYVTVSTDSKGRHSTEHHYLNYTVLEQELDFPELRIYPENLLSKIGQMLGYADIDFESAEFSRAYTVRSPDKKFAYDICHTRMMEYLLAHRGLSLKIQHQCVATRVTGKLAPDSVESRLRQLVEIRRLFPEYLYRI